MTSSPSGGPAADREPGSGQVFVLGRNRSGTKWLTNQLSSHPLVAAITAPETGVLEANIFEHMPKMFGDLSIDDNYYAFLACFMKSSYFQRTGLQESVLYERRHQDYLELFLFLMERVAAARGATHWLQKGTSLMLPVLHAEFPHARYLIMRRGNVLDNVLSSIALRRQAGAKGRMPSVIARELASYYLHRGVEEQYLGKENVHLVTYEGMMADKERELRRACEFLGLEFDHVMLADAFPRNTSFKKAKREDVLTKGDLRTFDLLQPVVRALPVGILRRLYQGRVRPAPRKGERMLVRGSFKTFRREVEALSAPSSPAAGDIAEGTSTG